MLQVSKHAKEKFVKLTGCKSTQRAENRILKMIDTAEPIQRRNFVAVTIRRGFTDSKYFKKGNMIFVVAENVVITCYEFTPDGMFGETKGR